jgi:hypothetical protein
MYVVTGQQFGGIPPTIGDNLGPKFSVVMNLLSSWLGPLSYLAVFGLATSIVKRPRYVLLTVVGAAMTAGFAAAYANSGLERYFLVPAFVAFTFVGLGLADAISIGAWLADGARSRLIAPSAGSADEPAREDPDVVPDDTDSLRWQAAAALMAEAFVAVALIVATVTVVPPRQHLPDSTHAGGVSQAGQSGRESWLRAVLASPDQGGLPANSVVVSNWSDSTTLWYGQKVEGLRPDVYVVDDRTRLDNNLGEVWNVVDTYLGRRPVFLLRFAWRCDGMDNLSRFYTLTNVPLAGGYTIKEVTAKTGSVVCQ